MEIKHPILLGISIFIIFSVAGFLIGFYRKSKKR